MERKVKLVPVIVLLLLVCAAVSCASSEPTAEVTTPCIDGNDHNGCRAVGVVQIGANPAGAVGCVEFKVQQAGNTWLSLENQYDVCIDFHELGDTRHAQEGIQYPLAVCPCSGSTKGVSPHLGYYGFTELKDLVDVEEWPWSRHYLNHGCFLLHEGDTATLYYK